MVSTKIKMKESWQIWATIKSCKGLRRSKDIQSSHTHVSFGCELIHFAQRMGITPKLWRILLNHCKRMRTSPTDGKLADGGW